MALEVIMPKAGVDMTEGQIVQWNKKVGEFVKEGEILLEIMTDKDNLFRQTDNTLAQQAQELLQTSPVFDAFVQIKQDNVQLRFLRIL